MIAAALPQGPVTPPVTVSVDGQVIHIDRRYSAPTGKVCIGYRLPGAGVGMATLDDTDRLEVLP